MNVALVNVETGARIAPSRELTRSDNLLTALTVLILGARKTDRKGARIEMDSEFRRELGVQAGGKPEPVEGAVETYRGLPLVVV